MSGLGHHLRHRGRYFNRLARPITGSTSSGQNGIDRMLFFYTRKPHIEPLETVGQLPMVNSQAVQDGGVEVVDVDRIFNDVVAEFVSFSIAHPGLDSAASHPNRETAWMMIAPVVFPGELSLAVNRTSKFPSPHNERII